MITNSFIFLPGINAKTEQNIWKQDIKDWNDFLNCKNIKGIGRINKLKHNKLINVASKQLQNYNSNFFTPLIPSVETWRLYDHFKDDACFLDIETSGFNSFDGYVTVVGIYDGYDTRIMVKNMNLNKEMLKKALENYKLMVTFNGSTFDLPVLRKYYGNVVPDVPHIDLRHCCARLGINGGLKQIEEKMNIERPKHLKAYGGDNAIDLWRAFLASGDKEYLNLLVQYNEEDIVNLKPLMEFCYRKLKDKLVTTI